MEVLTFSAPPAAVATSLPKRAFDLLLAAAALLGLSPAIALIALAIKREDGGPVMFIQRRVGLRGGEFDCWKFRTMVVGAEGKGRGLEIEQNDPRITSVGAFLRRWTLDEIPQLVNVLRGEMSIVGPRPTVMSQVERYDRRQLGRLEARPGMAGWAWIHGRNTLPWEERIELDLWYIDNWSFGLDMKILWRATLLMLGRRGVYSADGAVHDFR